MNNHFQTIISPESFSDVIAAKDVVVFDCRFYLDDKNKGRREYLAGHIPGAVYLDLTHDLSSPVIKNKTGRHPLPHPEILACTLASAGVNNDSQVIVYDQSTGSYASRAWWLLRWLGHECVAVLDGGFEAWKKIEAAIDNTWPLPRKGNLKINAREEMIIEMSDISSLTSPLVDSRDRKRYSGEYEPIDAVAGHIPGAVCIPYMDNVDASGKWKTAEELKVRFEEISTSSTEPVFYCGSGVTACHNILAYKIATGRDARLYPGSWSEWINFQATPSKV
jgi:thiosulfate/3-mercaptopyruvate sulfurtransferase